MKLFDFYTKAPKDKKLHFLVGAFIGLVVSVFVLWTASKGGWFIDFLRVKNLQIVLCGVFFGVVAGALKEIVWDSALKKGVPEMADFKYTVYGSLFASVFVWIVSLFLTVVPPYTRIPTEEEYWKQRMEEIHRNDPASFNNNSQDVKNRTDSLLKKLE